MKLLFSLAAFVALVVGCSTIDRAVFNRSTNVAERVIYLPPAFATNTLTITNTVNGTNILTVTNYVMQLLPAREVTNYLTNVTVTVNQAVETGIAKAANLNGALNPTPTAPLVNAGLALISTVLGGLAAWQTRKANRAQGEADTQTDLLTTVIKGVEAAGSSELKGIIEKTSQVRGNADDLDKIVQTITRRS